MTNVRILRIWTLVTQWCTFIFTDSCVSMQIFGQVKLAITEDKDRQESKFDSELWYMEIQKLQHLGIAPINPLIFFFEYLIDNCILVLTSIPSQPNIYFHCCYQQLFYVSSLRFFDFFLPLELYYFGDLKPSLTVFPKILLKFLQTFPLLSIFFLKVSCFNVTEPEELPGVGAYKKLFWKILQNFLGKQLC